MLHRRTVREEYLKRLAPIIVELREALQEVELFAPGRVRNSLVRAVWTVERIPEALARLHKSEKSKLKDYPFGYLRMAEEAVERLEDDIEIFSGEVRKLTLGQ
ncbi:hypothetical protein [Kitasatospora sp. NPDC088783]|uniref:hypothetical protein n=1 Tax=Kitasatospora sp. NPDC088783 TaxID=3364077 RepID=UPI0037FF41F7